jgi:hypothetical protein
MGQKNCGNAFISVYKPIAGWKAVCVVWDEDEQEYFPEQTAYFAHQNKEDAIAEAKEWAEAEEIEFHL